MENISERNNYRGYVELGGIINEVDYDSALLRLEDIEAGVDVIDKHHIKQAENIARFTGIELYSTEDTIDPRVILYGILRSDVRPKGVKYHHDQMSDQRIFIEVLRMLGDAESVKRMIEKYPNISF